MQDDTDYKRIFLAVFLAAMLLTSWQAFVEWPRRQHLAHYAVEQEKAHAVEQAKQATALPGSEAGAGDASLTPEQRLAQSPRLSIVSDKLHGSIALKGARFDDLTLAKYKETLDPQSSDVLLFSPNGDENAYFAQIGWVSPDGATKIPDQKTLWQSDKKTLGAGDTANLRWDNGEGMTFILSISLDKDYMFNIGQRVENHSGHAISVIPYAYINRAYDETAAPNDTKAVINKKTGSSVVHTGPLGVMTGSLEEVTYKELHDKGNKTYDGATGWFGITDQYWLSALIPDDTNYKVTFSHYTAGNTERYQTDYLGHALSVAPGASGDARVRLFAGAKELRVLDRYAKGDAAHGEPPILLFDRAIDFGLFYFLSKPLLQALTFFYALLGNFGLAIMLLTVIVRAGLYPLANKSFKSMAQMKKLQPEMLKIRERYVDDQIALNKEMLALYKREKVNPASGCLPIIIQMPVFIALYKVLYVSIEMRHAPFFGWLKDLSVTDPSNIFTAFGLIPWDVPPFLHLGLLPLLYTLTMLIQMKQQPKPADPVQARMMTYMPWFLLFVFAKMPAGLVVYWTWSNILSILQQRLITLRHGDKGKAVKAAA